MYPFVRYAKETLRHARAPRLGLFETHATRLRCWPWDIDPWAEMNNGRTLTLYDLGRIPHARRIGLWEVLARHGWGIAVAGSAIRYRRRIAPFQRFELRTRLIGWDERFLYGEQGMWVAGDCANAGVLRIAVLENRRMMPPARLVAALGRAAPSPPLPDWVVAWTAAEAQRPWPPQGLG